MPTQSVVRDRPILFSSAMVRAILEGRKTQTRRPVKSQAGPHCEPWSRDGLWKWLITETGHGVGEWFKCPYGQPGDRIWVRETFVTAHPPGYAVKQAPPMITYRADRMDSWNPIGGWKPSIHMPRWASRIQLEVTKVRVERVQDMNDSDRTAEGYDFDAYLQSVGDPFVKSWNSIYAARGFCWDKNPWVWAVSFKRV